MAINQINVCKKISWNISETESIRVRPKYHSNKDIWKPMSEEKISRLNPVYILAKPDELFWVHQQVFIPNPSERDLAYQQFYKRLEQESDKYDSLYWKNLLNEIESKSREPLLNDGEYCAALIQEVWTDEQFTKKFCS